MTDLQFVHWQFELTQQQQAERQKAAAQWRLAALAQTTTMPWHHRLQQRLPFRKEQLVIPWLQRPKPVDEVLCN